MIPVATMPTLNDLLTDLAYTESLKTQHRAACIILRGTATACLAAELAQERAAREQRLAEATARLATAAARCAYRASQGAHS